ncbi:hypothetical protein V8F06_005817 [Rhypophila decipiens]
MRMSQTAHNLSSRWLGRVFNVNRGRAGIASQPPTYLCPALWTPPSLAASFHAGSSSTRPTGTTGRRESLYAPLNRLRQLHSGAEARTIDDKARLALEDEQGEQKQTVAHPTRELPENCVGCGAFSQTTIPGEPGYYNLARKVVKEYMGIIAPEARRRPRSEAENVVKQALEGLDLQKLATTGVDLTHMLPSETVESKESVLKTPLCDRCHDLKHNSNNGIALHHPELEDLMDTLSASPYKYNHIYHVLDAADFPMSLLPKLRSILEIMPLRSQNRRATASRFFRGRKMELSFIITRSDLLGHSKEKVDHLMPYLREVLRDALGRLGRNVRLGNVRCVSAKRNWWTTELKNEIFQRGGAGWMVGKVNVGKSALFAEVFPKGHTLDTPPKHDIRVKISPRAQEGEFEEPRNQLVSDRDRTSAEAALLPAPREETKYPDMPIHSPIPGTTAAPIRISFGNGKGELIDLPGISRGDLSLHVKEEKRGDLIMTQRPWPEEQSVPFGRSLLLGGFIRITPKTPNLQFLASAFTPLEVHAAQTSKCIAVQEQLEDAPKVENISRPGTGSQIKSAGTFALKYDVTMQRAGSVVRAMMMRNENPSKRAVLDKLPFRVLGVDILIEGVGWVEIVAQVRKRDFLHEPVPLLGPAQLAKPTKTKAVKKEAEKPKETTTTWSKTGLLQTLDLSDPNAPKEEEKILEEEQDEDFETEGQEEEAKQNAVQEEESMWPTVEVFTPEGRFIGARRPMSAYMINKPADKRFSKRQRKSMKGVDKRRRMEARERRSS